ncbi:MAG TPA: hypothetical protein PLO66_04385 [Bacteroidales bacterium]|nr:hypothetical protein [Bacteroidales bacterium]
MKKILIKNIFLIIMLIGIFPKNLYQQNDKCKYGIRYYYFNGQHVVKNQRKQLLQYLSFVNNDTSLKSIDKHGKIKIPDYNFYKNEKDKISYNITIPDSLVGIFKIKDIIEKKNNYQKIGNKLVKRKIYYIDLECIEIYNDTCSDYIRVISIEPLDKKFIDKNKKIQIGNKYKMKIYSFFSNDCCKYIDSNNEVIFIAKDPHFIHYSYLIYDIWVPCTIDILSFNLFETSNLKGLYYNEFN